MSIKETLKYATYRLPVIGRLMSPRYPYKIDPGQLCALVELIESSRQSGGSVIEIGVAQGDTSVFLLEHLRTMNDDRELLLFDTFSGFTDDSITVEVEKRGKDPSEYDKFHYGDEAIFRKRLFRAGYARFKTFKGDASQFDWSGVAPIGAVLLDIDLYAPTKTILQSIYPCLCAGGGIIVDDCVENTPWDGSLQAYEEFISANNLPFERVGYKGAAIRRSR